MLKIIFPFLILVLLFSCNTAAKRTAKPETKNNYNTESKYTVPDSIVNFLISTCVSDLKKQKHLSNIQFRNSHIGINVSDSNEKQYLLCGEFKSNQEQVWIPFATIKTKGYEQWQGVLSSTFCQDSTVVWMQRDYSESLNNKLTLKN